MKIKKIDEQTIYLNSTTEHKLLINDKEIRIYEKRNYDTETGEQDYKTEMDWKDSGKLSNEELEYVENNIDDLIDIKVKL